ncbi:ABC transporter substrate-binding protein [Oceanidesulfovibrio marinus]|uniref:ABC transporter substrate-binding protein n=1 Tax=Oceanidesulfovibrio marinus TaxID=370038 RepID=A0ABX6NKN9_9BACT|nr:ABC transporter substrate-binding protein [Oceanidesulfovibrio marinus]QJT10195.1 ABC transporter substrate-binding protein [Oceanidesulfovibrio marinus]
MLFKKILITCMLCLLTAGTVDSADIQPIKIGGLFAESGKVAFVGTASRLVAEMTLKEINDNGGILGRPVKMVVYDTESDPNVALRMARELVEKDDVLAIIGPTSTGSGMAIKKYTEEQGIPTIMTVGGDPVIAGGKFGPYTWTFKVPQRSSVAVRKIYQYLQSKGVSSVALLTATDGFGQDGLRHLKSLAGEYGMTVTAEETMDPQAMDFSAQAFKLSMAQPQAVIIWTIGPAGAVATKNFSNLPGEKPLLVQCHGQPGPKFLELAGQAAEGVVMPGTKIMAPGYLADDDPQKPVILKFIDDYTAQGYDKEFPLNTHSGYAFDAITLLKAGLEKAGTPERAALRDSLEQLQGVVGVSGVFSLTPEDHNGLGTDSMMVLEVKDGAYRPAE